MYIKGDEYIYDISFRQAQIEITGKCNMHCKHCRASFDKKSDMPIDIISNIVDFAMENGGDNTEVILSGGEPLLHKDFSDILDMLKEKKIKKLIITTNGSINIEPYLDKIKSFNSLISISLDSINKEKHDEFRGYKGAFDKAINTIKILNNNNIKTNIRTSIIPEDIDKIPDIAKFVHNLGVKRLSISSIIPTGRALENKELFMTKEEKQKFIEQVNKTRQEYLEKNMQVITSDPLRNICNECCESHMEDSIVIEGCTAGITNFNVNSNGDLTPCAMLNKKVLNVFETAKEEISDKYANSEIIKNLVTRNLKGKCSNCKLKNRCGGCRARAENVNGDYLHEDPDCWLEVAKINEECMSL